MGAGPTGAEGATMTQSDDPSRGYPPQGPAPHGATPYGSTPQAATPDDSRPTGPITGGQLPGGSPYPQPPPAAPPYGQPQPQYEQPAYTQSPYGQPSYEQPSYGQPAYGPAGYEQYGSSAVPARTAHVIVPAVLGFVFAVFGILATLGVFLGGAALVSLGGALDASTGDPFVGVTDDAAAGIGVVLVVVGLLFLAWTVLMVWGSAWALTGRSRVLLLVGGSIAALFTFIGVLASLFDTSTGSGTVSGYAFGVVLTLIFFLAALAIVVPLCLPPATQFFAAHRARRGR